MKPNIYECKSCKAKIIYMKTVKNKFIPVNYEEGMTAQTMFDRLKHTTHFVTCPNSKAFRKPVPKKGGAK